MPKKNEPKLRDSPKSGYLFMGLILVCNTFVIKVRPLSISMIDDDDDVKMREA